MSISNNNANNLKVVNPQLAAEWHPVKNGDLNPIQISPGSHKKVWWLGKCGHEWQASAEKRNNGEGCPYCFGHKLLQGYIIGNTINVSCVFFI